MAIPAVLPEEEDFKNLNRAMARVLLEECYDRVIDKDAPLSSKMELLKLNVKLGDLEPKQAMQLNGSGFSVQIMFNGAGALAGRQEKIVEDVPDDTPSFLAVSPITSMLASLNSAVACQN